MMANKASIGSATWLAAEKENVQDLIRLEKEEIIYPAQHELEWLNEHMADIFDRSQVNVANIFKTPGKLKGKTPRTARKRMAEERIPLSNVFSPQVAHKPSPQKASKGRAYFQVAHTKSQRPESQPKSQADSGYHGSSQVEEPSQKTPEVPLRSPLRTIKSPTTDLKNIEDEAQTTEGSFHSAKENHTLKVEEKKAGLEPYDIEMPGIETAMPQFNDIGSPSDESTPDRPPIKKKGSITFASLPAREPMKTSIGTGLSRASQITRKSQAQGRISSNNQHEYDPTETSDDESNIEILGVDESEIDSQPARFYSKASTQRLHDRIDALGKAPLPRPSKSVVATAAAAAAANTAQHRPQEDLRQIPDSYQNVDNDDWIKPLQETRAVAEREDGSDEGFDVRAPELIAHEERMKLFSPPTQRHGLGHVKSASTVTLQSPAKQAMGPPPSPSKSFSVSNLANTTTTPQGSPSRFMEGPLSASKSKLASIMKTAKGLFTSSASVSAAAKLEALPSSMTDSSAPAASVPSILQKPLPASPPKEIRKTRSSTQQEEERKKHQDLLASQVMNDQLDKAQGQEKQKAAQAKLASPRKDDRQVTGTSNQSRAVRSIRDVPKTKPQPMSIKVGTMSHRINPNQETLQGEPKRPGLTQKGSTTSLHSASSTATAANSNFKTSVTSQPAKPRALIAAERKKEQDEREAQRKFEQKRELERKRAAQQEEARKQEQEQRAEAERRERERIATERAKRQAQQQAIEKKRQEAAKKAEQQRLDRAEPGPTRPPSRIGQQTHTRPLVGHALPTNPAKPAKRPVEDDAVRSQAPQFGAASQQADAKRRRTEDENSEPPARPTMSGAPIRQSQMGKKPSIFNHPSYQHTSSQAHLHGFPQPPRVVPQMSQFANAKIPFAEPSQSGPAKTPLSAYQHRTIQPVKSSPHYQHGESIQLPDIPTDSEDEDSETERNAFPVPVWATSGHLTGQLMRQEGTDGDAVFGPIAPLKMEEIFAKGNKDRLKRLRDRTSSANWALSGDGLTLEEVRADREQRERMRVHGGWQYGTGM